MRWWCAGGGATTRLLLVAGLLVCSGFGQNAEPGRRLRDSRNSPVPADKDGQRDNFSWDVPPEGGTRTTGVVDTAVTPAAAPAEVAAASPRGATTDRIYSLRELAAIFAPKLKKSRNHTTRSNSWDPQPDHHHDGDGEKCSCNEQQQQKQHRRKVQRLLAEERENLVNVGGRNRLKKKRSQQQQQQLQQHQQQHEVLGLGTVPRKTRGRQSKFREERRRRRRNRKQRARNAAGRTRFENVRRAERPGWRVEPLTSSGSFEPSSSANEDSSAARFPGENNPLNLSSTRYGDKEDGSAVGAQPSILDRTNNVTSSSSSPSFASSHPSQLTTEPRIPLPPEPTTRYRTRPSAVEREFSRQVEREFSRAQRLAEAKAAARDLAAGHKQEEEVEEDVEAAAAAAEEAEEEEEEEEEGESAAAAEEDMGELPRFDEHSTKRPDDLAKAAAFDPERMLGYSRTDEDLPILDMENEVLQRTLQDYNAYISSSAARAAMMKAANHQPGNHRRPDAPSTPSTPTPSESIVFSTDADDQEEEDLQPGDLSCINGTFLPAPFVRHAVIKYVKSSSPGHEYLEADYECEDGHVLADSSGGRLLCRERRWIGRLPVCRHRDEEIADGGSSSSLSSSSCTELGCEQLCRTVGGRATCLCREGFRLEDGRCIDVDECEANGGRGPCQDTCRNYAGGYACACDGLPGAHLAPDNRTCRSAGPCGRDNAGCSHTCLATMGRVFCLCPDGFVLEDDWKTCQDVDECAVPDLQTEICRHGCVNTPGSYRCAPTPQRQGAADVEALRRGSSRRMEDDGSCQPGYELAGSSNVRNCVDVNECATNNGGCSEVCENTEGSYFCACEGDERILSSDRRTCVVPDKSFGALNSEVATLNLHYRKPGDVFCSPLNPAGRGYLICSDLTTEATSTSTSPSSPRIEEGSDDSEGDANDDEDEDRQPIRPGTKCHLQCPRGYELRGEYELTCRADGTWDGPKHGECLRYSEPRLDCPKDVVAELPPGRDEAFVTYDQPSTDLDWFRYVRSKPSWGTRLEANLKLGVHEIAFYARHPVSKKQASCTFRINVEEGQAPKVQGCPSDIEVTGKNGSAITWIDPTFTDNVKVTRVTSNESPGNVFGLGGHKVEYEASDEAGWTTKCIFTVVLRPDDQ